MARPERGEVWRVDLGLAGKVRPAVVVSAFPQDYDYALIAIIPHTTPVRGSGYEVALTVSFYSQVLLTCKGYVPGEFLLPISPEHTRVVDKPPACRSDLSYFHRERSELAEGNLPNVGLALRDQPWAE